MEVCNRLLPQVRFNFIFVKQYVDELLNFVKSQKADISKAPELCDAPTGNIAQLTNTIKLIGDTSRKNQRIHNLILNFDNAVMYNV